MCGIPIGWSIGGILRVSTSSYVGEIQDASRGFDASRFLKCTISEILFGNGNIDIATRIRNDNSIVVERSHVTEDRRSNGLLESNSEESGANRWLSLSHITGR